MERSPVIHFQRIVEGEHDSLDALWVQNGLRTYRANGGSISLDRCLGLPSVRRIEKELRDFWLADAARQLDFSASRLLLVATRFQTLVWPHWRNEETPLRYLTPIEESLFQARKANEFPTTVRQYQNIINARFGNRSCRMFPKT